MDRVYANNIIQIKTYNLYISIINPTLVLTNIICLVLVIPLKLEYIDLS